MATTQETNITYRRQDNDTTKDIKVKIMEPKSQHVALLAKNIQGQHQTNVVIDPTTGA